MEYNVFKKINSSMSFKSYNIAIKSLPTLCYANGIFYMLNPHFVLGSTIINLELTGFALATNASYTKDVTLIKTLYDEFIKNYTKLNKIFDLSEGIQSKSPTYT